MKNKLIVYGHSRCPDIVILIIHTYKLWVWLSMDTQGVQILSYCIKLTYELRVQLSMDTLGVQILYWTIIPCLHETITGVFCERPHTSSIVQDPSAFLICIFIMKSCVSNISFFLNHAWLCVYRLGHLHSSSDTYFLSCVGYYFIMRGFVFMDLHTLALPFWYWYWYNLSCADLCLRTCAHLHSSSDKYFLSCAALC